jgi:hypothetical protein
MRNGVVEVERDRSWRNGMKCNYLLLLQNLELCETVEIEFLWRVNYVVACRVISIVGWVRQDCSETIRQNAKG